MSTPMEGQSKLSGNTSGGFDKPIFLWEGIFKQKTFLYILK